MLYITYGLVGKLFWVSHSLLFFFLSPKRYPESTDKREKQKRQKKKLKKKPGYGFFFFLFQS